MVSQLHLRSSPCSEGSLFRYGCSSSASIPDEEDSWRRGVADPHKDAMAQSGAQLCLEKLSVSYGSVSHLGLNSFASIFSHDTS